MFKNYLKIAFRNLKRNKGYSLINILGLAVGMASAILILLWVLNELSYDRFHNDLDNKYRVVQTLHYSNDNTYEVSVTSPGLAYYLRERFPEIRCLTRATGWSNDFLLQYGDKSYNEPIYLVDPEFFKIFNYPFVIGNAKTALENNHSIVFTESSARKYFKNENSIGKPIKINEKFEFTVTGVIKDIPKNSNYNDIEFIIPFKFYDELGYDSESLGNHSYYTFIHLSDQVSIEEMNKKLKSFYCEITEMSKDECKVKLYLQPLKKMHLYWLSGGGPIGQIKVFSLIAIFILVIACINYINLSTAMATKRLKEVGVKKVHGANRKRLILQFFSETILLSLIALFFALLFVESVNAPFNNLIKKELAVNYSDSIFIISLLGIIIFTGFVAGIYPALYISSFNPVRILKSKASFSKRKISIREILVVSQFFLAITLIINTSTIQRQMNYLLTKDQGLNKENMLKINIMGNLNEQFDAFKKELIKLPGISSVTVASASPLSIGSSSGGWSWQGSDVNNSPIVNQLSAGYDFVKTFDIKMLEGEFFPVGDYEDTTSIVINKTFAHLIGIKPIVGKVIKWQNRNITVRGVVNDFHFHPATSKIEPLAIYHLKNWSNNNMFVKLNPGDISQTINEIDKKYKEFNPNYPFEYTFMDKDFKDTYARGIRMGKIFNYFSFLTIFISCLGLFGLASFAIEQRIKEIGIRKAHGASIMQIILLNTKAFSKWVFIAFILASPLAYFIANKWLQNQAYRIDISPLTFIYAGTLAFVIALLTVGFKIYYAAKRNPVEALRYE